MTTEMANDNCCGVLVIAIVLQFLLGCSQGFDSRNKRKNITFFSEVFTTTRSPVLLARISLMMLAYTLHVSPHHFLSLPLTPSHPPPSLTESFEPPHQHHLFPSTLPSSSRPLPFQHKKRWTHGLLATTTGCYV